MLRNYIKIAWRNILRHRLYTAINLIGLFVGMTFVLFIAAFIWKELQVNKELHNANRQFILMSEWTNPNMGPDFTTVAPLAKELFIEYPHLVENYYRWDGINSTVSNGELHFKSNIQIGDETLLDAFGFKLLHGNKMGVFEHPYAIVISEAMAVKYFGRTDVIDEALSIASFSGDIRDFKITGVLEPIGQNSVNQIIGDEQNSLFVSRQALDYFGRTSFNDWANVIVPSYITLKEGVVAEQLTEPIASLVAKNAPDNIKKNLTVLPKKLQTYYLTKNNNLIEKTLYTLAFVGLFILIMALVNYINISIGHSRSRMREIGIRKVLGGSRKELIFQFLTESVLFAFLALALSLISYMLFRDWFGSILGSEIPKLMDFPFFYFLAISFVTFIIGGLAGLYPALVLSSIGTIKSLKNTVAAVSSNIVLRKALVGFQFGVAFVLMLAAVIISKQTTFFFEGGLGYNKDAVISLPVPRDWSASGVEKMVTIRDQFKQLKQVAEASLSYEIPNGNNGFSLSLSKIGTSFEQGITAQALVTDDQYLNTYKIPMKRGSFFEIHSANENESVINEKALNALGWMEAKDAIGETIQFRDGDSLTNLKVIGVIEDFHFGTKQSTIVPQIILNVRDVPNYRYLSFKLNGSDIQKEIKAIELKWNLLLPGNPFDFKFMDETLESMYADEIRLKKASFASTGLALSLVILGIFGLVSLSIQRRFKEIGIRKILGASGKNISFLFIKDYLLTFIISIAIAAPLGYLIMKRWLDNYSYKISISADIFLWISLVLLSLTLLLVTIQTLIASRTNPVKNLRTD